MKLLLPTNLWLLTAAAIPSFARPLENGHDVYPRDSSYVCLSEDKTLCPTGNIPKELEKEENADKQRLKDLGCHDSASDDQDGTENATTPALQPRHEHETCDSLEKQLESGEPHHHIPRAGGGEWTVEKQIESILIKTSMMNCTQHPEKDQVAVAHELQPHWGVGSQSCDILESYLEKMEHGIPFETEALCREIASLKACRKEGGCPVHPGKAQESTTHELQRRDKALGTCVTLQKQIHSWKHGTIPIPPDVRQTIINNLKAQMKEMNCLVQPTVQELQSRSLFSETCPELEKDLKHWENAASTNVVDPLVIYGMIKETTAKMRKKNCPIPDDKHSDSDTHALQTRETTPPSRSPECEIVEEFESRDPLYKLWVDEYHGMVQKMPQWLRNWQEFMVQLREDVGCFRQRHMMPSEAASSKDESSPRLAERGGPDDERYVPCSLILESQHKIRSQAKLYTLKGQKAPEWATRWVEYMDDMVADLFPAEIFPPSSSRLMALTHENETGHDIFCM